MSSKTEYNIWSMTTVNDLERRAWYRFLKLCYALLYFICVALVVGYAYTSLPYEYLDDWNSTIICTNGKSYPSGTNSIYVSEGRLNDDGDIDARKLCTYDVIRDYTNQYKTPKEKNYNLITLHATRGSYKEAGKILFWGLPVVYLVGELIRRSFLYVLVGQRFFP